MPKTEYAWITGKGFIQGNTRDGSTPNNNKKPDHTSLQYWVESYQARGYDVMQTGILDGKYSVPFYAVMVRITDDDDS